VSAVDTLKHSIISAICLSGAVVLFSCAVLWGIALIERSEAPTRTLASHFASQTGRMSSQDMLKPNVAVQARIALIIAALSTAAGVGLARGIEEASKAFHCRSRTSGKRVDTDPGK